MAEDQDYNQKLIASKQKWAVEGRLLVDAQTGMTKPRLPPGQSLVTNWPVLDLGVKPYISTKEWQLKVIGKIANPIEWDWATFMAQPQIEDVSDMHCVTQWSRYDNKWQGVSTRHLLDVVKPDPVVNHVILHSHDGYTTNVRLDHFADDDCLIAHSHDGQPITREHGGPARLIIPKFYLWKSAKWIKRIEFTHSDKPGFWEVRGYHNVGDPWRQQRYS